MRILHTADWHLGRTLEGRSRIREQEEFLDEIAMIAEKEKADIILMAGDVFDTVNPPAAAETLFYDAAARLSDKGNRPFIAVSGNHDHPDRLCASIPLAKELGITLIGSPEPKLFSAGAKRTGEIVEICALPYPSESRLKQLLADTQEEEGLRDGYDAWVRAYFESVASRFNPKNVNLAMSHIYVAGGNDSDSERPIHIGGAYTVAATTLPASAQYTALGHLHRPQNVKRTASPARYSGSPISYSFSEAGQSKSVTMIDVAPGQAASITEIPLSSGKPLVAWEAKGGLQEVYQFLDEGLYSNAWIDLSLHLTEAMPVEEIQRLRKRHDGIIHIKPVYAAEKSERERSVKASQLPPDQLFKAFYEKQTGGAVPGDELVSLFLELLNEDDAEEVKL
ncbi:exonuclease SbcCD subunit D [Fictibacillus aquaticus]|uniref:Nuclease SbcCD subunit D n=1 Tax=Fictibacillus aquaticus TaxID=2021314 RepID=A0A235FCS1_9BACL|nr:exonuclease SbcCD subunit D [Fictibacillus aquaticus]OYD59128.1 exonuclease sbcCD subunit D [Fictibacillus aquaticus]